MSSNCAFLLWCRAFSSSDVFQLWSLAQDHVGSPAPVVLGAGLDQAACNDALWHGYFGPVTSQAVKILRSLKNYLATSYPLKCENDPQKLFATQ